MSIKREVSWWRVVRATRRGFDGLARASHERFVRWRGRRHALERAPEPGEDYDWLECEHGEPWGAMCSQCDRDDDDWYLRE